MTFHPEDGRHGSVVFSSTQSVLLHNYNSQLKLVVYDLFEHE